MTHEQLIEEVSCLAQWLHGPGVEGHEVEWVGWLRAWAEMTVRHYKEQAELIGDVSFLHETLKVPIDKGREVDFVAWVRKWAEITVKHCRAREESLKKLSQPSQSVQQPSLLPVPENLRNKMLGDQFNPS